MADGCDDPNCKCQYSDKWVLYFVNASAPSPRPFYFLATQWAAFYPQQLARSVNDAGFQVIDEFDSVYGPTPDCTWEWLGITKALGVERADLGVNGTRDEPHGQPGIQDDISKLLASNANYPYVEISILVTIMMFVTSWCFGCCCGEALWKDITSIARDRREKKRQAETLSAPYRTASRPALRRIRDHRNWALTPWHARRENEKQLALQSAQQSNNENPLLALPRELHDEIFSYLSYRDLVETKRTCRHYAAILDADFLSRRRQAYEYELFDEPPFPPPPPPNTTQQQQQQGQETTELACAGQCFAKLPVSRFATSDHGVAPRERKCIRCHIRCGDGQFRGLRGAMVVVAPTRPFARGTASTIIVCGACHKAVVKAAPPPDADLTGPRIFGSHVRHDRVAGTWQTRYECWECYTRRVGVREGLFYARFSQFLVGLVIYGVANSGKCCALSLATYI